MTAKTTAQGTRQFLAKPETKKQTRRPPNNPDMPDSTISFINITLNDLENLLDDFQE